MFDDENLPRKEKPKPKPLDNMSIEELEESIRAMKEEIARAEAEIVKKKKHRDAMSSLFKS